MSYEWSQSVASWQRGTMSSGQVIEKTGVYLSLSGVNLAQVAWLSRTDFSDHDRTGRLKGISKNSNRCNCRSGLLCPLGYDAHRPDYRLPMIIHPTAACSAPARATWDVASCGGKCRAQHCPPLPVRPGRPPGRTVDARRRSLRRTDCSAPSWAGLISEVCVRQTLAGDDNRLHRLRVVDGGRGVCGGSGSEQQKKHQRC